MKHLFKLLVVAMVAFSTVGMAQDKAAKEIVKERKAVAKLAKSELKDRASKEARKEAKRLTKEGWQVNAGALPLSKMLDRSYEMYFEYAEDGSPLYIVGEGRSHGGSYAAADKAAQMLALTSIAEQIEIYVTELIEQTVGNKELTTEQAVSINEVVASSKSLVSQKLRNTIRVLEISRKYGKTDVEVIVRLAYNKKSAMEVAKEVVRQELEKKGEDLHKELDNMLWK